MKPAEKKVLGHCENLILRQKNIHCEKSHNAENCKSEDSLE